MRRLICLSAIVPFAAAAMAQELESTLMPPLMAEVPPVAISRTQSCTEVYPADARAAHIEGATWVLYRVATDGTVKNAVVAESSGSTSFFFASA